MPDAQRAVLFDMDGVLIDSYEAWFELMNAAARAFGAAPISREAFAQMFGQGSDADARLFGCSVAEVEAFFEAHFLDHVDHVTVEPSAADVLAQVRERGLRSAVITNTQAVLARRVLERVDLAPDALVGGDEVPQPKPAPDMVLRACELLAANPTEALVVGDSAYDRDAARAAGVRFAGLGISGDLELQRLADVLAHLD